MCYLHYERYFYRRCAPISYFILSMRGFLSIHTNVFLVGNQPDEEHDEEIETPDEEKENLFSFFLIEFLDSFLDEKHTHNRFGKKALPAFFLMDFAEASRLISQQCL